MENPTPLASHSLTIRTEIRPGDIGGMIALHGVLYAQAVGFDWTFESYVATSIGKFFESFDAQRDRVWLVEQNGQLVGSIALKGRSPTDAQLRYFLLHPTLRGRGLGRELMDQLLACARDRRYQRIFLLTDDAHAPAATHLYVAYGFRKTGEQFIRRWGTSTAEQRYELEL
jgi:GNAT superfamily N-acetyltransferase